MISALGGAAIAAAGSVLGSGIQSFASGKMNKRAEKFNREEAQKSRDYTTEMWNKNNEYNTPSNQMQRYKDAGLNPYMMNYDGGDSSAAQSSAQSSAPNYSIPDYSSSVNQVSQSLYANIIQQAKLSNETKIADAQAMKAVAEANQTEQITPFMLQNYDAQNHNLDANRMYTNWLESSGRRLFPYQLTGMNYDNQNKLATYDYTQRLSDLTSVNMAFQQIMTNKEFQYLAKYFDKDVMSRIQTQISQGNANDALAALHNIQSKLTGRQLDQFNDVFDSTIDSIKWRNGYDSWTHGNSLNSSLYSNSPLGIQLRLGNQGSGIDNYQKLFPNSKWDLGIYESHTPYGLAFDNLYKLLTTDNLFNSGLRLTGDEEQPSKPKKKVYVQPKADYTYKGFGRSSIY